MENTKKFFSGFLVVLSIFLSSISYTQTDLPAGQITPVDDSFNQRNSPALLTSYGYFINGFDQNQRITQFPVTTGTPVSMMGYELPYYTKCGDFDNNRNYYTLRYYSGITSVQRINLYAGIVSSLGTLTGLTGIPTSINWNPANNTMYVSTSSGSTSRLFTINFQTLAASLIGVVTNCTDLAAIAINCQGEIYGIDAGPDNLVQINPSNAQGTVKGPLGFNASSFFAADFDLSTGIMYFSSYNVNAARMEYRSVNTANGNTTLIAGPWYAAVGLGIDNRCGPVPVNDIKAGFFLRLPAAFYVNGSYSIKASIINNGTANQTNVPVKFLVNGVQSGASQTIPSLPSGAVDTSLSFSWTPTVQGYAQIAIVSALSSDTVRFNDTAKTTIFVLPVSAGLSSLTICRNGLNKGTNDLQITRDTIYANIPGAAYLLDANVKIDTLGHTWDSDLSFMLTHLNAVSLISYRGGSGDNFLHTVLDDSASLSISQGTAPFIGSFRPEQPLSVLNGTSPSGAWILEIFDGGGGDTGILRAWCVTLVYYSITGVTNNNNNIPVNFSLSQNYPNPFNPSTSIKYEMPKPSYVKLIIYDDLGKEVARPVDGFVSSVYNEVIFDAGSLSSGVYFYRIEISDGNKIVFNEAKKMLLVK